jgi:hypothetical protein
MAHEVTPPGVNGILPKVRMLVAKKFLRFVIAIVVGIIEKNNRFYEFVNLYPTWTNEVYREMQNQVA